MRLVFFRGKFNVYHEGRRTSLRTSVRAEAERRFIDYQSALKKPATTVGEIFDNYVAERRPRVASKQTLDFAIKKLTPSFGGLRPDQVNRTVCREYVVMRHAEGVGNGTIRREMVVLNAALHWADKATPAIVELPPAPQPKPGHLTREQYRALRDAAKAVPHLHVFVVLAYSTAGRASAILDLTWDRVDFERGQIRLATGDHGNKGRATVPMTDAVREVCINAKRASVSDFVVEYAGRQVGSVKRAFKAAAAKAGLPRELSHPHILRHSSAVHMAEGDPSRGIAPVPMEEIGRFLGHNNLATTYRIYAVHSPSYLKKAAMALE